MSEKNFVIKNIFNEISKPKKGFIQIANPTGSGKSYETSLAIVEMLKNSNRKIYYITPRLKNVSDIYEEIKATLKKINREDLIEKVLKIDSYGNSIISNYQVVANNKYVKDWQETKDLIRRVEIILNEKTDSVIRNDYRKEISGQSNNCEYKFRQRLREEFKKDYKAKANGKSELEYMRSTAKWRFIEQIYPASIEEKQVFILSSSKFLYKNDPIISPKYFFTQKEVLKDTLVIIDEIDYVKTEMNDNLIKNQRKLNLLDMFDVIYDVFLDLEGMDTHLIEVTNAKENLYKIKEACCEIKEKYFPEQRGAKFYDLDKMGHLIEMQDTTRIMNYQGVQSYYDNDKKYVYCPYRKIDNPDTPVEEQCNKIVPKEYFSDKNGSEVYYVSNFLKEMKTFIVKSCLIFNQIANRYMVYENKKIKGAQQNSQNLIDSTNSITSILKKLHFDEDNARKLGDFTVAVTMLKKYQPNIDDKALLNSFYSSGLYYNIVLEVDEFRYSPILYSYELPYTAETILLDLAQKCFVIGLSATAEVNSLDNFNHDFLRQTLTDEDGKSIYYELTNQQKRDLKKDYQQKTKGYKKVTTKVTAISVDGNNNDGMERVHYDLARLYYGRENVTELEVDNLLDNSNTIWYEQQLRLNQQITGTSYDKKETQVYDYSRLKKIWKYIEAVLTYGISDEGISNGLIITSKSSKSKVGIYTLENIALGAYYIHARVKGTNLCTISAEESKELREEVFEMFEEIVASDLKDDSENSTYHEKFAKKFIENKPVFMITTYASVGRGNNLQVFVGKKNVQKMLNDDKLIAINDWENKGYLDWDSIYMEKPTYVIPNIYSLGNTESERKDNLLRLLVTTEESAARFELSRYAKANVLKAIFNTYHDPRSDKNYATNYNTIYTNQSVKNAYSTFIYQTIGRISRTNVKKKVNHIFYDSELLTAMEFDQEVLGIGLITHEFERFLEAGAKAKHQAIQEIETLLNNDFSAKNNRIYNMITNTLYLTNKDIETMWTEELINFWEELRSFLLKYPVISKEQFEKARTYFDELAIAKKCGFNLTDVYLTFSREQTSYYYSLKQMDRENDFEHVLISPEAKQKGVRWLEASRYECRLAMLMNNLQVKNYWQEHDYNIDWKIPKGEKWHGVICPVIYNNIYKGAIGEEVVKCMLETMNIACESIKDPKKYEKFDFIVHKNGKSIYIDAKNFSYNTLSSDIANKKLFEKVKRKVAETDADKAFIINIIDESEHHIMSDKDKIITVPGIFKAMRLNDCTLIRENDFDVNSRTVLQKIVDNMEQL